jgi:GDPmannose 4,6-dehydratase
MVKKALITGITGQDGSYLAEFLLEKGYEVHGIVRRASTFNRERIEHLTDPENYFETKGLILHYADLTDSGSIEKIMAMVMPDEIYNLGAQSHVRISFDIPENTADIVALGTLRMLEAMRKYCPNARFYQASSSEMFGKVAEIPQTEKTPFHPRSPYGCAKVFAHSIVVNYREAYNLFACCGILFNHESEKRGENFVTKKITKSLARIKLGLQKTLVLGNLDSERDWGHARDYVEAMWLILQQDTPEDYVVGTGEKHSVREFLEESAKELGLKIKSNGLSGFDEKYLDENNNVVVEISQAYFRPAEVELLQANPQKAKIKLGWNPKIKFKDLVKIMVKYDLKKAEKEALLKKAEKEAIINVGRKITNCRMCDSQELYEFLDLGFIPPADGILSSEEIKHPEIFFPLKVCQCQNCGLTQLSYAANPRILYGEKYKYESSITETGKKHFFEMADSICRKFNLEKDSFVIDIGSNAGILLEGFKRNGMKVLGIDPAPKIAKIANERGIETWQEFISPDIAKRIMDERGKSKIITGTNVFAHIDDKKSLMESVNLLLDEDGVFIIEVPYLLDLMDNMEYDTIYVDHLEYLSVKPLINFFNLNLMDVFDVERYGIHGKSIRVFMCKKGKRQVTERVHELLKLEEEKGIYNKSNLDEFSEKVKNHKKEFTELLRELKKQGKKIVGISAPAKGNTILNYCKIGTDLINYMTEKSIIKRGHYTPGMHIPIYGEEKLIEDKPDYGIVFAWNFADEIIKNNENFKSQGGKFIIPIPYPKII